MKHRAAYWLARLYPASWRERYGEEFDALVEDSRPGWRGVADIGWGALAMQWRTGPTPLTSALLLGLLGLAIATPVAFGINDIFISSAAVPVPSRGVAASEAVALAQQAALSRQALYGLMKRHRIYGEPGSEESLRRFQTNIKVTGLQALRVSGGSAFRIHFSHESAAKAQAVTRDLTTLIMDQYASLNRAASALEVLDSASLPQQPAYPNRPVAVFTGVLAGVVLGTLLGMVRRALVRRTS